MKMPTDVYESLRDDIKAVIAKVEEVRRDGVPIDPSQLTNRVMWDYYHIANTDRSHEDHPRHHMEGMLPRCVPFTDRSPYFMGSEHDLNDSHIETAFRAIIAELTEEYEARQTQAPGR